MSISLFFRKEIDWYLLVLPIPILFAGLVAMSSFSGQNEYFQKQSIWIFLGVATYIGASLIDWRFLKNGWLLLFLFAIGNALLASLFLFARTIKGAQSWFSFGGVAFQPSDLVKILVIIILAKYFTRRHVEIAKVRHVIISGIYACIPLLLVLAQPDFGSAIIFAGIWLGMILVSGVSKKHLLIVFISGIVAFLALWIFAFKPYQKLRIVNFFQPTADVRGSGYNAMQSQIAVGSGMIFGKGVGYGTQSRLKFLPEYQTDFIFAAFAEEWGLLGVLIMFIFYGLLISRIMQISLVGASNFESLFGFGLAIMLMSHITVNIGMNIGLLPITGITLPFMSYGGTHIIVEYLGLGMLSSMKKYSRGAHRDIIDQEMLQIA